MKNDTSSMGAQGSKPADPLGLENLGEVVSRLTRLRDESAEPARRPARWELCVDQLADAYDAVATKYELLRDRYSLLKRSGAQLHDELVWLRDQFDDLCGMPATALNRALEEPVSGEEKRYGERWSR